MKTATKTIAGKQYPYVLCPRCEIWIHQPDYESHKDSALCDRWFKNKAVRRRAEGKALGKIKRSGGR